MYCIIQGLDVYTFTRVQHVHENKFARCLQILKTCTCKMNPTFKKIQPSIIISRYPGSLTDN